MSRIILCLCCIFPLVLIAQSPFKINLETRSGYEHNVFRAGDKRIIINEEGDSTSAIQGGFFQHFNAQIAWKKSFDDHQFSFKTKAQFDYFPQLAKANRFRPEAAFRYKFKLAKKTYLFYDLKYLNNRTDRIPDQTTVLALPRAYKKWQSNLGYKFSFLKYNKSQIQLSVFKKQYDPGVETTLGYRGLSLDFKTTQRFKKKKKPAHYLSLNLNFSNRNYLEELVDFEEEEEEEEEDGNFEERIWRYYTAKISYASSKKKTLQWEAGLAFQNRTDVLEEKFGYSQLQPFASVKLKQQQLSVELKTEATFRRYSALTADKNTGELLKHQYLRTSIKVNYALDKNWALTFQGNLKRRWRNRAASATTFLPYTTGIVSAGIKYTF